MAKKPIKKTVESLTPIEKIVRNFKVADNQEEPKVSTPNKIAPKEAVINKVNNGYVLKCAGKTINMTNIVDVGKIIQGLIG